MACQHHHMCAGGLGLRVEGLVTCVRGAPGAEDAGAAEAAQHACRELEAAAKQRGVQLLLPTDLVITQAFDKDAPSRVVSADAIPDGWMVRTARSLVSGLGCIKDSSEP